MKRPSVLGLAVMAALGTEPLPPVPLCSRGGCHSNATWKLGARVWAKGATVQRPDLSIELRFPLNVCDEHKAATTIAEVIGDSGWTKIVNAVRAAGRETPDRRSLELVFTSLVTP